MLQPNHPFSKLRNDNRLTSTNGSTFHEPLVPRRTTSNHHRRQQRERRKQRWDESPGIELTTNQQYRPPSSNDLSHTTGVKVNHPRARAAAHHGETRPIINPHHDTNDTAYPLRRRRIENNNNNPVEDLSYSLCSHGICCFQCVRTQEIGITENCGAFDEIIGPGLYCALWPFSTIAGRLSLRVQQVDVTCETKTKDDVFLWITVSVQFRIIVERSYDAYYSLTNVKRQIQTNVYSVIRSTIPQMSLDFVFESKSYVSDSVFTSLQGIMKDYGYEITATLVTRLSPNSLVKNSMNEINAAKRLKDAMPHKAEAEKIQKVKQAEIRAETLYLQGTGLASQRRVLAQAIKDSVNSWSNQHQKHSTKEIMDLLLLSQYLDTLTHVRPNQIILRPSPAEFFTIQNSLPHREEGGTKQQENPPNDLLLG